VLFFFFGESSGGGGLYGAGVACVGQRGVGLGRRGRGRKGGGAGDRCSLGSKAIQARENKCGRVG
jgi:hypothetical protein